MNRRASPRLLRRSLAWLVILFAALNLGFEPAAPAGAAPEIFASPVQAGCYVSRLNQCKIHVEPYTIYLSPGAHLGLFQLVATAQDTGRQSVVYDFKPDISNPAPFASSTYAPSPVAKDFGARCGVSYSLQLQGKDSLDTSIFGLGGTGKFTCPTQVAHLLYLPKVNK